MSHFLSYVEFGPKEKKKTKIRTLNVQEGLFQGEQVKGEGKMRE